MERWLRNSDNKIFNSEEDAYEDSMANEDLDFLLDTIIGLKLISHADLVYWAAQQDGFWDKFDTQISEARAMIFDDNYGEISDEELEALGIIPT